MPSEFDMSNYHKNGLFGFNNDSTLTTTVNQPTTPATQEERLLKQYGNVWDAGAAATGGGYIQ